MISKKTVLAWVFSGVVGLGMFVMPGKALAHGPDHDRDGWNHSGHDNGRHWGWENGRDHHEDWDHDHDEAEQERRNFNNYPSVPQYQYRQPAYGYNNPAYRYNQPAYGLNQPAYPYSQSGSIDGMVNRRHPNLVWTCGSDGHHCHWAQRVGSNNRYNNRYPQTGLNPFALGGATNGYSNGYNANGAGYNNNYNYANGYYGNSPTGGLGSMLGPLFGAQQP